MKKAKRYILLSIAFFAVFVLAGCQNRLDDTYQDVEQTKTICWGIRADTRLFGLTNIKTGKIEGFEVDLANALTKQILGKNGKAEFLTTTANTRIPLLKNHNIDAVLATMTITPEREKQVSFSKPYFHNRLRCQLYSRGT